jgi:RsmE family RNA methyltransferase
MYIFDNFAEYRVLSRETTDRLKPLRLKKGDDITITNLKGSTKCIKLESLSNNKWEYNIISEQSFKLRKRELTLAQIDRVYLDKLAEILPLLNITKLNIVKSKHSRSEQPVKLDRLIGIMTRSAEQSERVWIPEINIHTLDWSALAAEGAAVLDMNGDIYNNSFEHLVIGPEGGWSKEEAASAGLSGISKISLGDIVYPSWFTPAMIKWS